MGVKMSKYFVKSSMYFIAFSIALLQLGCEKSVVKSGFLSDYDKLETKSASSLQYVNDRVLDRYSRFIVDPVNVRFLEGSQASRSQEEGRLSQSQIDDMTEYMHDSIVQAVMRSGNVVVNKSGPGIARIRSAFTDIDKSYLVSYFPLTKMAGTGVGGASLEAEIVDSLSGEQIGAIVESQHGSTSPFDGLGDWDAARQVMDEWGRRFELRLSQTRQY